MNTAANSLEERLRRAAAADNWTHVLHRCAWCRRLFDASGAYDTVIPFSATTVVTDGMCGACGARALTRISERNRLAA